MKKFFSILLSCSVTLTPMLSSTCSASRQAAQPAQATQQTNTSNNQPVSITVNPANAQNQSRVTNAASCRNQSSLLWKLIKYGAIGIIVTATGALIIDKFNLGAPLGTAARWTYDALLDAGKRVGNVVKEVYKGFSIPSNVNVVEDVSCANFYNETGCFGKVTTKFEKCANHIFSQINKESLKKLIETNPDFFFTPGRNVTLQFSR